MPYAVTLTLDAAAARRVAVLWETLAACGASDDSLRLGYAPHITLAILPDAADPSRILEAVAKLGARWRPVPVVLSSLGRFPGPRSVAFLAPTPSAALLARQADLLAALRGQAVDAHYRTGFWVPHVTLAKDIADPSAAIRALTDVGLPIPAVLDALEVVRFRPVDILASFSLR